MVAEGSEAGQSSQQDTRKGNEVQDAGTESALLTSASHSPRPVRLQPLLGAPSASGPDQRPDGTIHSPRKQPATW